MEINKEVYLLRNLFILVISISVLCSCKDFEKKTVNPEISSLAEKLFTSIPSSQSGVVFQNRLEETIQSNYYQYVYAYNGGGVATADFNNDGLVDLFFTSNIFDNTLYLNKGDFKFEDITSKAGIKKRPGFDTGVAVVDVNNDGYLDIYISRGGAIDSDNKFANMLYINNGDLTFTEKAKALGLADENRTINAIFFDYDNDNDLDVYIANASDLVSRNQIQVHDLIALQTDPETIAQKGSDRLYNNDGTGHFTDVSIKSGIMPETGFGLNPEVADFNNDGWLDIYVNNDFNIPDFVYLNNRNGTFTESRDTLVKHMSFNSMGGDIADINNDGLLDLMTLDMNPEDYIRSRTTMVMTAIDHFELLVNRGYHHQYMHNMLHLNNGNGTFSEIANMAGIGNTDWSWSLLSADFDLDGFNDLYITNGIFRDVNHNDKNNEILQLLRKNRRKPTAQDFLTYTKMLPQQKITNYFFRNKGDLTFEDASKKWNDSIPTFSNGAAYADFDNDGDLDLVVNNINDEPTLLKNNAIELGKGNFLQIKFEGPETNPFGVGTIANIYLADGTQQTRQLMNTRGFLSSVSNTLHFGLKPKDSINKLEIIWTDGQKQELANINTNQLVNINYLDAILPDNPHNKEVKKGVFYKMPSNYRHIDPYFNDYSRQVLLPHKLSQTGPAIAKADVNNDGIEDVFIGGGRTQSGQLLIGKKNGLFKTTAVQDFELDKQREDVGACFFDSDNDGDQDLYVVSGSYEFDRKPKLLLDRLYINDGKGKFKKVANKLPEIVAAGSVVVPADFDKDGDTDLFVGGRVIPGRYPYAPTSFLLLNNKGVFTIETQNIAPALEHIGMVTDAIWSDINNDNTLDLILCGEWMGIEVFLNKNGMLNKSNTYTSLASAKGWWNKIVLADVDNDGDQDIIAGNLGLNYKFQASPEKPFHIYTHDFDYNGVEDIFLAKYYNDKQVPVRGKSCTAQQLPYLRNKIKTYQDFANLDLEGILGKGIASALHYEATEFRSGIFINNGDTAFSFEPFSSEVQRSPINSILHSDFDGDGIKDLLLAGNNHQSEIETTRSDAGIGSFLKGNNNGTFKLLANQESGFFVDKDVRNIMSITTPKGEILFVANNNTNHDLFSIVKNTNKL